MNTRIVSLFATLLAFAPAASSFADEYLHGIEFPPVEKVTPGECGGPPSDAVILLQGTDMSAWEGGDKWIAKDGYVVADKGSIHTKDSFGDCQLHIEWASPEQVKSASQGRGNSGVYFLGKYEVQILDSWENETYVDGSAGAIYKQSPPMVNATRKPGEWQTYDIIFRGARFDKDGKLQRPTTISVLHNGVLIQDHFELQGSTAWHKPAEYEPHGEKAPLGLQFHGNPVCFRNIWLRELPQMKDYWAEKRQRDAEKANAKK